MRLTKSRDDIVVAGVLAGIGEYFQVDPTLIRIGAALLIFFSPFPVIPLYIIGAILIPKAPKNEDRDSSLYKKKTAKRDRRKHEEKDYEWSQRVDEQPSSTVEDIEEEDWSDF